MQSHHEPVARPGATAGAAGGVLAFVAPELRAGADWQPGLVALEPGRDALGQIAEHLAHAPEIRAVVLLAGEIGEVSPARACALRRIGEALGPQGAVVLHGAAATDEAMIAEMERLARIRVVGLPAL